MNGNDILRGMQYLDETYIEEAEFGPFSKEAFSRQAQPRRLNRIILIAAAISLGLLLVGCGVVYLLSSQELTIDQREMLSDIWVPESEDHFGTEAVVPQQVLAINGLNGTPSNKAAKEWYEFEVAYANGHDYDESFPCPPEYEYYWLSSQEMVDKLEEILAKYDMKPVGAQIEAPSEQGLLNYLGIESFLLSGSSATLEGPSISYFDSGFFSTHCYIQMEEGADRWPYKTHVNTQFIPKDILTSANFVLDEPEKWEEWNYRTPSGDEFLILYRPDYYECYAICHQKDRSVGVYIQTAKRLYTNSVYSDEVMNKQQVEQLLDVMDFSIVPTPGDPALLSGLPANYDASSRVQTQDGYTVELKSVISDGHMAWATIAAILPEGAVPNRISFDHTDLYIDGEAYYTNFGCRPMENSELLLTWYDPDFPEAFTEGTQYSLVLERMYPAIDPQDNKYPWESNGTWKFDFTFDAESDYRKLEFISQPTEILSEDGESSLTVTSLSLHSRSAAVQMAESISSPDPDLTVILKDGTSIPLNGYSGQALNEEDTACVTNLVASSPIPLDEVDHLLLIDGTKLYPQT